MSNQSHSIVSRTSNPPNRALVGLLAGGIVAAIGASASAQSFNIDLDVVASSMAGAPSSAFGAAAGQTGFWNAVDTYWTNPVALNGLSNNATSATLLMTTNAPNGFAHWSYNNTSNTGDFAKLLNDCHIVNNNPGPWSNTYTFSGLQSGIYQVYTYGVRPLTGLSATRVTVTGGTGPATIMGPMPGNSFALGVTHAIDTVTVTGGTLVITVDRDPLLMPDGAYVNGFQLIHHVPAPGSAALLALAGVAMSRRRR